MADATEGRKPATEDPRKLSSGHKLPQNVTRNWDTVRRKLERATGTRGKEKNETLRATRSTKSRSRNSNSDDECQDFAHHTATSDTADARRRDLQVCITRRIHESFKTSPP